ILECFSLGKLNHFTDSFVYIYKVCSGRRFLHERTHSADDGTGSVSIVGSTGERFSDFLQIWRVSIQETQRRADVVARRRNGLVDLMCNRSSELPHRYDAVRVRQLHVQLAKLPLSAGNL